MREAYDEVYAYTMGRAGFILQHAVDAYGAQTASDGSKPIGVIFALVGLYLRVERQFSGGDVQKVHMRLGRQKRQWPAITLPRDRGSMTAADVLAAPEGRKRDQAIDESADQCGSHFVTATRQSWMCCANIKSHSQSREIAVVWSRWNAGH